ncbi:MAG: haloacid dehalogenase, partial [Thermomicrobia bacterium]|nr:haloacid dehalogenase [Thermomicrobia bacterium]
MSAVVAEEPQLIHALPGRIRVHVPGLAGAGERRLETHLRALPGVRSARANGLTSNVLICFDPAILDEQRLLSLVRTEMPDEPERADTTEQSPVAARPRPAVIHEQQGNHARARIAVRGMESNPALAREVVARLEQHPGVKATANPLTSRVLVQFNTHLSDIDDLVAEVMGIDLPDVPDEAEPTHPLDPGPLVQSATRTVGTALGFGFLAVQRLASGGQAAGGVAGAAQVSGVIGLLQGIPFVRYGLRRLLGRTTADLLVNVPNVVSLALSNNPLGLAVMGAEAVRLLTETMARRAAWKRYEERLGGVASAEPGAVIRLETGERTPLDADIIEGTGNAIGRDAMPIRVMPGATVPAGARLLGGPFVLCLHDRTPFVPQPRPAPLRMSPQDRYTQVLGPLSLGYAALTAVTTRSFARTFASLLLVNPRTAMIGQDAADVGAFARVLRSGVIAVDSRPHRVIRRPDLLLLDGPRMLTDGFELSGALPLSDAYEPAEVQMRAASIAAAIGSPWAGAFRVVGAITALDGAFDGTTATATIDGSRYSLGPVTDETVLPAAIRLQRRGNHLLLLRDERAKRPLGVLVLRPRLALGVGELVETCRRHGTEIALLDGRNHLVAQGVAQRADVVLLDTDAATDVIRARQATGAFVAFASDNTHAGEAFAATDLAIGVSSGRSSRFPARADLLAPDLTAVAAIVEAGARRDATARDSVGLSVIANAVGAVWGFRGAPGIEGASRAVYITALGTLADGWLRLRGGERSQSTIAHLVDPRPERWGRRSVASTLAAFNTTEEGLTTAQAAQRHRDVPPTSQRNALLMAVLEQLRSP